MLGKKRFEWYTRRCKRCGENYRTRFRQGNICGKCDLTHRFPDSKEPMNIKGNGGN